MMGWREADGEPVSNLSYWLQIADLWKVHQHHFQLTWQKGHAKLEGNEQADELANQGLMKDYDLSSPQGHSPSSLARSLAYHYTWVARDVEGARPWKVSMDPPIIMRLQVEWIMTIMDIVVTEYNARRFIGMMPNLNRVQEGGRPSHHPLLLPQEASQREGQEQVRQ